MAQALPRPPAHQRDAGTILYYNIVYYNISYSILYYIILYYTILYYTIPYYRTSAPATRMGRGGPGRSHAACRRFGKGQNGVSTNGVTAFLFKFPLTYFYLPKSARVYLFPQSVNIHYFCSGPISVDPICPQPKDCSALACGHVVALCSGVLVVVPRLSRAACDVWHVSPWNLCRQIKGPQTTKVDV